MIDDVQPKHAQTSLRPPAAFQARMEGGFLIRFSALFHVKQKPSEKNFTFDPDGFF